jgi:Fur family ferric uptake transcriptional regulator
MRTAIVSEMTWREHALDVLKDSGRKAGGARSTVIAALADERCCLSVPELHDRVRRLRPGVGIASVYRALETLDELGLVRKVELGSRGAQYEPAQPSGDHHHHLVCGDCGKVEAFRDDPLEHVIDNLSKAAPFRIDEHDVVLRGLCEGCST